MDLLGIVEKVNGDEAIIQIKRVAGCGGNCEACGGSCESAFHGLTVKNTIGAKPGETVEILFKESESMKASLIIYLVPLAGFLLGLFIAYLLKFGDITSLLISVLGMAIGFLFNHFNDNRYKKTRLLASIKKHE